MKTKQYSNFYFIKSGEKDHLISLQKRGHIYMNYLPYFAKCDNTLIGDPLETVSDIKTYNKHDNMVLTNLDKNISFKILNGTILKHYYNCFAYCLHFFDADEHSGKDPFQLSFKGEYFLIINGPKFLDRLNEELLKMRIDYSYGHVSYQDFFNYSGTRTPFQKDLKYKIDREWRLLLPNEKDDKVFQFEMGNLEDISFLAPGKSGECLLKVESASKHPELISKKISMI